MAKTNQPFTAQKRCAVQKLDNVQKPNTFKKKAPIIGNDASRCGKITRRWLNQATRWSFFALLLD